MLHYRKAGEGPPLVLIHGLFGSLENLGGLARLLAENFTVYSVDLPNHGRSPHVSGATLATLADSLNLWLDSLALASPILIGHSLGGKVAMEVALSRPQPPAALVVLDIAPVPYAARHQAVFAGLLAVVPEALRDRRQAEEVLATQVSEPGVRSFLLKNLVREGEGFRWRMNLADLHACYADLIAANREGCFDGPVLFLRGADSDYLQASHQAAIASRFPRAEFRTVTGAGHWLHVDKPETVAVLIRRFLQRADQVR